MPEQVLLGPRDEAGSCLMQSEESLEIDLGPVHDLNRTGFGHDQIQSVDIVQFPLRDIPYRMLCGALAGCTSIPCKHWQGRLVRSMIRKLLR